jgi:hypothetical protein
MASVNRGLMNEETGHYATLVYAGCDSAQRAKEITQALFRAAKRNGYSVHCETKKRGKQHDVHFTAINKEHARRYVVQKYGTDRSAWPYNPRARNSSV